VPMNGQRLMDVALSCPSYTDASAIFGKAMYQFFRQCGKPHGLVAQKTYKAFWDEVRDIVGRKTSDIILWESRVTMIGWGINEYDFCDGNEDRFFVLIEIRYEGRYRCMHISMRAGRQYG